MPPHVKTVFFLKTFFVIEIVFVKNQSLLHDHAKAPPRLIGCWKVIHWV